ncbi:MAG: hypothetical protein KDJ38_06310 [Gammaproteobacteria bacterium]|nr:hypothetical protein [Gammaproteobacteria bacterium]
MNLRTSLLLTGVLAVSLSACSDDDDTSPRSGLSGISELQAGSYLVSVGDTAAPQTGRYYADDAGNRLLLIQDDDEKAQALYRQTADGDWVATPENSADDVAVLLSHRLTALDTGLADLSGDYIAELPDGTAANFTLGTDGQITAITGGCQVGGSISESSLPDTFDVSLTLTACGDLTGSLSGHAFVGGDFDPPHIRLLTTAGDSLVELWAFAD